MIFKDLQIPAKNRQQINSLKKQLLIADTNNAVIIIRKLLSLELEQRWIKADIPEFGEEAESIFFGAAKYNRADLLGICKAFENNGTYNWNDLLASSLAISMLEGNLEIAEQLIADGAKTKYFVGNTMWQYGFACRGGMLSKEVPLETLQFAIDKGHFKSGIKPIDIAVTATFNGHIYAAETIIKAYNIDSKTFSVALKKEIEYLQVRVFFYIDRKSPKDIDLKNLLETYDYMFSKGVIFGKDKLSIRFENLISKIKKRV